MEVGISLRMGGKGELVLQHPSLRAGGVEGERVGGTPLSSFPLLPAGACPAGDLHFLSSSGGTWSRSTRASDPGGPPGDTVYSPRASPSDRPSSFLPAEARESVRTGFPCTRLSLDRNPPAVSQGPVYQELV